MAVIRENDGGRRMYCAGNSLPTVYTEGFPTQNYSDWVDHPGERNKIAVVAGEDDDRGRSSTRADPTPTTPSEPSQDGLAGPSH
jgi:hypothetical protein